MQAASNTSNIKILQVKYFHHTENLKGSKRWEYIFETLFLVFEMFIQ